MKCDLKNMLRYSGVAREGAEGAAAPPKF